MDVIMSEIIFMAALLIAYLFDLKQYESQINSQSLAYNPTPQQFESKQKMLNFTHNSRQSSNPYQLEFEQQYQPIVITNGGTGKQQQMPQPTRSKKKLVKAHSNSQAKKSIGRTEKPRGKRDQEVEENRPWNSETVTKTVGVFDRNLKKDTLAAQERQIRAESRIQQNAKHRSRDRARQTSDPNTRMLSKQEEIHRKKIEIVAQEQEREIVKLRQMIEKERLEKERNDMEYEAKKRKIEAERRELMELEKEIQRQGPKAVKEVREKIKYIEPVQDKVRLKQSLDQQNPRTGLARTNQNYFQITQSESLANQKSQIRQHQLEYLVQQREKAQQQYQRNTLGYTPTLIPLLSKASYKIISTHISSLVQLFIDDLLEEQVYLLEAIELEMKAGQAKEREREILVDYVDKLENFVEETERIQDKIGKYSQMRFEQIYKPPSKPLSSQSHPFTYQPSLFTKLQLALPSDDLEQLQHRVQRFKRYVSSFDEYKGANLDMFKKVTEEIINEAIQKLAKELDSGAGEFVNVVFRSQFQ